MRAARLYGIRDIRVVEVDKPTPGPGEVLIRIQAVGICGTDIEIYTGRMPFLKLGWIPVPETMGHEWSGIVEETGPGVTGFSPGDRVTEDVTISCRVCEWCKQGRYNICPNRRSVGIIRKDGAFAEYLVMPAYHVYHLPDGVTFEEAALTEPTATSVHAVRRMGVEPGDRIVVFGDGTLGLLAAQAAFALGASAVVLVGTHKPKLEIARSLGVTATVEGRRETTMEDVLKALGGKADGVVEASGRVLTASEALQVLRPGGRMVVVSIYHEPVEHFDLSWAVTNEIAITGTLAAPNVFPGTLRLMAAGRIRTAPLITHRIRLEEVPEYFASLDRKEIEAVKVLVKL